MAGQQNSHARCWRKGLKLQRRQTDSQGTKGDRLAANATPVDDVRCGDTYSPPTGSECPCFNIILWSVRLFRDFLFAWGGAVLLLQESRADEVFRILSEHVVTRSKPPQL